MSNLVQDLKEIDSATLNLRYEHLPADEIVAATIAAYGNEVSFANSFGLEDVALTHLMLPHQDRVEILVLDTGRLPKATFAVIEAWQQKYGLKIRIEQPASGDLHRWVSQHGLDAFYQSVELRQQCCHLRKIEPLERALSGKKAWLTGLRRSQSHSRQKTQIFERDTQGRLKVSPLANWSLDQTWSYVKAQGLPYNRLHDKGFPSIGCEPCTRAVKPGEDIRAGRWWWEGETKKECGLHSRTQLTTPQLEILDARQS
mgnify:CR=1 FL=1